MAPYCDGCKLRADHGRRPLGGDLVGMPEANTSQVAWTSGSPKDWTTAFYYTD